MGKKSTSVVLYFFPFLSPSLFLSFTRRVPQWRGRAGQALWALGLRSCTMRQRDLVKPGAEAVFGPPTPDPRTIWLMIVVIRYTGSAVHPSLG